MGGGGGGGVHVHVAMRKRGGQQGRREVYKWDPSFFMHRGDIPPSANFTTIAQSLASLISALGTFVKGLI